MDDLVAFLSARLDEREAAAKAAAGPDWHTDSTALMVFTRQQAGGERPGVRGVAWCSNGYGDDAANMHHIALHDPDSALREVAADRALIDRYVEETAIGDGADGHVCRVLYDLMRARAAVWSNHPGYRQEWAPDATH